MAGPFETQALNIAKLRSSLINHDSSPKRADASSQQVSGRGYTDASVCEVDVRDDGYWDLAPASAQFQSAGVDAAAVLAPP